MAINREEWLTQTARLIEPLFYRLGQYPKQYRITCGWPCRFATSATKRRIGECHPITVSKAGLSEVFISPTVADSLEVAGVVCHELIHVAVGTKEQHKGKFLWVMKRLGMAGKPTSCMPGGELKERIAELIKPLGEYPHSQISVPVKIAAKPIKSVKLVCPACACEIRIGQEFLEQSGAPSCGCGAGIFEMED